MNAISDIEKWQKTNKTTFFQSF